MRSYSHLRERLPFDYSYSTRVLLTHCHPYPDLGHSPAQLSRRTGREDTDPYTLRSSQDSARKVHLAYSQGKLGTRSAGRSAIRWNYQCDRQLKSFHNIVDSVGLMGSDLALAYLEPLHRMHSTSAYGTAGNLFPVQCGDNYGHGNGWY